MAVMKPLFFFLICLGDFCLLHTSSRPPAETLSTQYIIQTTNNFNKIRYFTLSHFHYNPLQSASIHFISKKTPSHSQ